MKNKENKSIEGESLTNEDQYIDQEIIQDNNSDLNPTVSATENTASVEEPIFKKSNVINNSNFKTAIMVGGGLIAFIIIYFFFFSSPIKTTKKDSEDLIPQLLNSPQKANDLPMPTISQKFNCL